jgi:predicted aspartyl protease
MSDIAIFRTNIIVSPWTDPTRRHELAQVMVDTGSEYSWIPAELLERLGVLPQRAERFESADGRIIERQIGFALIETAGRATPTIVVFAQQEDMVLLGAIALEGLNLRVDLVRRQLVPAGPIPVAGLRSRATSARATLSVS